MGIEIGKGSDRTLGDAAPTDKPSEDKNTVKSDKDETAPLRLILKPRANYTDAARQAQVQGAVRVRVTFLASGGIGSVSAFNALPYGLTEQAIAAASKIVFIPAQKNKTSYSVVKTVEYRFSIY